MELFGYFQLLKTVRKIKIFSGVSTEIRAFLIISHRSGKLDVYNLYFFLVLFKDTLFAKKIGNLFLALSDQ